MPFQKNHAKVGGRRSGSKNQKTEAWEKLGETLVTVGAERFQKILLAADDKEFSDLYLKTIEHFKPKLTRASVDDAIRLLQQKQHELISKPMTAEEAALFMKACKLELEISDDEALKYLYETKILNKQYDGKSS